MDDGCLMLLLGFVGCGVCFVVCVGLVAGFRVWAFRFLWIFRLVVTL